MWSIKPINWKVEGGVWKIAFVFSNTTFFDFMGKSLRFIGFIDGHMD